MKPRCSAALAGRAKSGWKRVRASLQMRPHDFSTRAISLSTRSPSWLLVGLSSTIVMWFVGLSISFLTFSVNKSRNGPYAGSFRRIPRSNASFERISRQRWINAALLSSFLRLFSTPHCTHGAINHPIAPVTRPTKPAMIAFVVEGSMYLSSALTSNSVVSVQFHGVGRKWGQALIEWPILWAFASVLTSPIALFFDYSLCTSSWQAFSQSVALSQYFMKIGGISQLRRTPDVQDPFVVAGRI